MIMKKITLLVFALFSFYFRSIAQGQNITVVDSIKKTPVENANIVIVNNTTNTILQRAQTDKDGLFANNIGKGKDIFISITAVGYTKYIGKLIDAGSVILLKPALHQLKEVKIKGSSSPLKIVGTKMLYDISKVENADYLSTAEIIDRLPFLQIDQDQVKMMNEPVTVLIDGRPNIIYSTVDGLKALPPQAIERIELTLVPTARNNGAKTLNIILRRDYFLGFNGNITASGGILGGSTRASTTYWRKKYGFDASISYSQGGATRTGDAIIDNFLNNSQLSSYDTVKSKRYNGGAYFSGFYNVDSLTTFDAQLTISPNKSAFRRNSINILNTLTAESADMSDYVSNSNGFGVGLSLNYTRKGRKDGNAIYILTSFNHSNSDQNYTLFNSNSVTVFPISSQDYENDGKNLEGTVEAIVQHNSNKTFNYTVGTKFIARDNNNNYNVITNGNDTITPFTMKQIVSSNYADADLIFKKFTFHTALRLDYNRNIFQAPDYLVQNAFNFVPNLSLTYNLDAIDVLLVTYSRSLARPGVYQYTPVASSSNSYQQVGGNQNLKNELTNDYGLQYYGNYDFARLGVNFRYSHVSGLYRDLSSIDTNDVIYTIPINVDVYKSYTLGFSADFKLFKKIRFAHYSSGSYLVEKTGLDVVHEFSGYINDRIYYQINKANAVGFDGTKFSPNLLPQGKEQSMDYIKFGFNYSHFFEINHNLPSSFSISLSNPNLIKGYKSYSLTTTPDFIYRQNGISPNGLVSVSLRVLLKGKQYANRTFNKSKSIQNDDLHVKD
jgi:iron complex outermembrane recepter protein